MNTTSDMSYKVLQEFDGYTIFSEQNQDYTYMSQPDCRVWCEKFD